MASSSTTTSSFDTNNTNTNNNSLNNFTFSTHPFMSTTSFSDLLVSPLDENTNKNPKGHHNFSDNLAEKNVYGVPKFKSTPPPSLPLTPPSSSYFAIPPGLSPAELLDSPVMLNSSNILPSPTTGAFAAQSYNWRNNSERNQQIAKQNEESFPNFSFQTQQGPPVTASTTSFQSSSVVVPQQQHAWNYQENTNQNGLSSANNMIQTENNNNTSVQSLSREIVNVQTNNNNGFESNYNNYQRQQQPQTLSRKSDDGYNWRKYGQKQVKGSENPRSYYKCTYPNCPTKKKVERSIEGQITEIVYKGTHNHPKPQSTRRNSSSNSLVIVPMNQIRDEMENQSSGTNGNGQLDSVTTPENSSISVGDDEFEQSSQKCGSGGADEYDAEEPESKRWKMEGEIECISGHGNRTVREPRVVVQTTSDIDILDDGYRWRKYGQKVVKGNPNPRSYYKCTQPGCPVRKHVERASHDLKAVITTYEGKHNHDVPVARGSGSHRNNSSRPIQSQMAQQGESQYNFAMLHNQGNYGLSRFGNPMESYMNRQQQQPQQQQQQMLENEFSSRAKDEPKDDRFLESLLS